MSTSIDNAAHNQSAKFVLASQRAVLDQISGACEVLCRVDQGALLNAAFGTQAPLMSTPSLIERLVVRALGAPLGNQT